MTATGLDAWAADNLLTYLDEQREATRHVPDDRTIVVERFRDELGDWRVAVHSPFGAQVHAPWALCVAARMRERFGVDVQAMHGDDGIVFRLPDIEFDADSRPRTAAPGRPARVDRHTGRAAQGRTGQPASLGSAGLGHELMSLIALDADDVHDLVTTARSADLPCSQHVSASARPGRCCCRVAVPIAGRPCGSNASGRPSCSAWQASTRPSRSSWRRCASACRTCSTCRV